MTNHTYTVQDGYGFYVGQHYADAVLIALADEATACTIHRDGKAVAFKAAHSTVIDLIDAEGVFA